MASLTHRESAYLLSVVEQWARSEGHNLLYDTLLRDGDRTGKLLEDLRQDGYDKRVMLSVEVPVEQSLAQNANRWQQGRAEFDAGRDWYGGRMAPEGMIKDIYAQSSSGRGFSIGRENAERLVESRLATGLITSERGTSAYGRRRVRPPPARRMRPPPVRGRPSARAAPSRCHRPSGRTTPPSVRPPPAGSAPARARPPSRAPQQATPRPRRHRAFPGGTSAGRGRRTRKVSGSRPDRRHRGRAQRPYREIDK